GAPVDRPRREGTVSRSDITTGVDVDRSGRCAADRCRCGPGRRWRFRGDRTATGRRPLLFGAVVAAGDFGPGVEADVDDAFLHRDDRVVGDFDVLGADLGAALCDVALAEALHGLQHCFAVDGVERVHVELR